MISFLRQAFVAALVLAPLSVAKAADDLPRLTGELHYKNYPKFAAYLTQAADQKVALDITIPLDNEESDGHLTTFVLDGQLELAYLNGAESSKVYADTGFDLVDDKLYTFKGVFKVVLPEPGDPTLALETLDEEDGPFTDMTVDSLPTRTGN